MYWLSENVLDSIIGGFGIVEAPKFYYGLIIIFLDEMICVLMYATLFRIGDFVLFFTVCKERVSKTFFPMFKKNTLSCFFFSQRRINK